MTLPDTLIFNDGRAIPRIGLGVWQIPDEAAPGTVGIALEAGYRLVDTAAIYGNEAGVGEGLRRSPVGRDAVFLTTKVWNADQGFDTTLAAFEASLGRLGLDAVDLYLIHWPCPARNLFVETWRALIRLREEGRARSIGVSNFRAADLQRLADETGTVPALNQIELHPRLQQNALRALHERLGIVTQSWSPLGRGALLTDPVLADLAAKHGRTPAQIVLRWHLDLGSSVIPRSGNPGRIRENLDLSGFSLDADDLARMAALDDPAGRIGPDPDVFS